MLLTYSAIVALLLAAAPTVVEGELSDGDAKHPDRKGPMDTYEIETEIQQLLSVVVRPTGESLDTYLFLNGPSGQKYYNDDAPDGKGGSMLQIVIPEDGPWEAIVAGYDEETRGKYRFAYKLQNLKRLMTERGELTNDDEMLLKGGERADIVELDVEAGKTYVVQYVSGAYDTYLTIHSGDEMFTNDDSDSEDDASQIIFSPKASGKAKLVLTSSYNREARGKYSLKVYEAE